MKFIGIICTTLLLHNAYAVPVQVRSSVQKRSDGGYALYTFLESLPQLLAQPMQDVGALSLTFETKSPELQNAFKKLSSLLSLVSTIGTNLKNALTNPDASVGMSQMKSYIDNLMLEMTQALEAISVVSPSNANVFQTSLESIKSLKDQVYMAVETSVSTGESLLQSLDDSTTMAIQQAIQAGVALFTQAVNVLTREFSMS